MRIINPSRQSPWDGTAVPGEQWTREQLDALVRAERNPATVATGIIRLVSARGFEFGQAPAPQREISVPVLTRGRGGRALVVRPDGSTSWQVLHG